MTVDMRCIFRLLLRRVSPVHFEQPVRQPVLSFETLLSVMFSRDLPNARKEVVTAVIALITDAINAMFSSIRSSLSLVQHI